MTEIQMIGDYFEVDFKQLKHFLENLGEESRKQALHLLINGSDHNKLFVLQCMEEFNTLYPKQEEKKEKVYK